MYNLTAETTSDSEETGCSIAYYLINTSDALSPDAEKRNVCSLLIVSADSESNLSAKLLFDVSSDEYAAEELADKLGRGRVTPGEADYILEDWLNG